MKKLVFLILLLLLATGCAVYTPGPYYYGGGSYPYYYNPSPYPYYGYYGYRHPYQGYYGYRHYGY